MKENWKLDEQVRRDPFRVPEGYFESLTSRVMSNLPEQPAGKDKSRSHLFGFKQIISAAAIFIGFILFSGSFYSISDSESVVKDVALQDSIYVEDMMDYIMMDNLTIHQYLTDASDDF